MVVGDIVGGRYRVVATRSAATSGRVFEGVEERANAAAERSVQPVRTVLLHELDVLPTQASLAALEALASRSRQTAALVATREVLVEGAGFILVYELPAPCVGVRAETLTELVRRTTLPLHAKLLSGVLDALFGALATLHRACEVHGGLSPRNILWCGDKCLFLGAGLATEASGVLLAGHRDVFAYGAPEVLRREPPAPASDVFACAAIAHLLMTGQLPHQGKHVLETLDNRAKLDASPISALLSAGAEPFLDAFFACALATASDLRFRDGSALEQAWRTRAMPNADVEKQPHLAKLVATSSVAQREILHAATTWLEQGGELLPTELVVSLATELTDRIDRELCEAAWEDDDGPASRARIFVGEAQGGIVDSVDALPGAREDLRALVADARRDVLGMLSRIAVDHAPRGVEAVGDSRSHLRVRVGPHRLLYCVRGGLVVLTRIMQGFDPVAKAEEKVTEADAPSA